VEGLAAVGDGREAETVGKGKEVPTGEGGRRQPSR
jgi:hypothetical protein